MDMPSAVVTRTADMVTWPSLPAQGGTVARPLDTSMEAFMTMLTAQNAQMTSAILAMGRTNANAIDRASVQSFGREVRSKRDQVAWEIARITKRLEGSDAPEWYRTDLKDELEALRRRDADLVLEQTGLERQYHLLTAPDESVGARPSSC